MTSNRGSLLSQLVAILNFSLFSFFEYRCMVLWLNEPWFVKQGVAPQGNLKSRSKNPLQDLLYQTMVEGSLPMLLRFGDRSSMAHSIESRVPFLTADLVEFVLALPEEH